jgi:hypothetical protein
MISQFFLPRFSKIPKNVLLSVNIPKGFFEMFYDAICKKYIDLLFDQALTAAKALAKIILTSWQLPLGRKILKS